MEIRFEQKDVEVWRERACESRRIRVEMESVVPDVNEDVARVAAVRGLALLKSLELAGSTLRIGGELRAAVVYITEDEDEAACVSLQKEFVSEQELSGVGPADQCRAELRLLKLEARVLNPRKLALTAELEAEPRLCTREKQILSLLPGEDAEGELLHVRRERSECCAIVGTTEKSFALTDQLRLPEGAGEPTRILSQELQLRLLESNRIGRRLIVKGEMALALCFAMKDCAWPRRLCFCLPFSQIAELDCEDAERWSIRAAPTALYTQLEEGVGGMSVQVEAHALLQLVCRRRRIVETVSDAYSNRMPLRARSLRLPLEQAGEMQRTALRGEEFLSLEDCAELLERFPTPGGAELTQEQSALTLDLDLLYRTSGGQIAAARRSMRLSGAALPEGAQLLSLSLVGCEILSEGGKLRCSAEAELCWQCLERTECEALEAVELDEEHAYVREELPALTLLRSEGESLWELARRCHSSVEAIEACNAPEICAGQMLLIPRE